MRWNQELIQSNPHQAPNMKGKGRQLQLSTTKWTDGKQSWQLFPKNICKTTFKNNKFSGVDHFVVTRRLFLRFAIKRRIVLLLSLYLIESFVEAVFNDCGISWVCPYLFCPVDCHKLQQESSLYCTCYIFWMSIGRLKWKCAFEHAQNVQNQSSYACAKHHSGLCSLVIHYLVSNDTVSGQWRPW